MERGWITLSDVHVRSPPISERKPLDLSLGKDKDHDAELDANSDDDDHNGPRQLFRRHDPSENPAAAADMDLLEE